MREDVLAGLDMPVEEQLAELVCSLEGAGRTARRGRAGGRGQHRGDRERPGGERVEQSSLDTSDGSAARSGDILTCPTSQVPFLLAN